MYMSLDWNQCAMMTSARTHDGEAGGALAEGAPAAEEGGGNEENADGDHDVHGRQVEVRVDSVTCRVQSNQTAARRDITTMKRQ